MTRQRKKMHCDASVISDAIVEGENRNGAIEGRRNNSRVLLYITNLTSTFYHLENKQIRHIIRMTSDFNTPTTVLAPPSYDTAVTHDAPVKPPSTPPPTTTTNHHTNGDVAKELNGNAATCHNIVPYDSADVEVDDRGGGEPPPSPSSTSLLPITAAPNTNAVDGKQLTPAAASGGVGTFSTLNDEDFIVINVCGMTYETLLTTLETFPFTLLGNGDRRKKYFVECKQSYFFDRNRQSFEAILYYYQSGGTLIRPPNIPMRLFEEEICFFGLGQEAFQKLQENEGYIPDIPDLPEVGWQRHLWELFEYPDSSLGARILASWSILVIIISISVFCMETMPMFRVDFKKKQIAELHANISSHEHTASDAMIQPWYSLELGCIVWFTLEYIMRFISSPKKLVFIKSFLNVIDLLAILPYFMAMSINSGNTTPLSVLRVVRLVRVFRIFKLSRHSLGLRILGQTLNASLSELGMLIFFLFLGVILFSSAIYYAEEGEDNDNFVSIPDTFWFSLVTMTTVGYGDMVPQTLIGKLIGSLCAVSGVLTIALPVPVIVSNFEFFYKRDAVNYEKRRMGPAQSSSRQTTPAQSPEPAKRALLDSETAM